MDGTGENRTIPFAAAPTGKAFNDSPFATGQPVWLIPRGAERGQVASKNSANYESPRAALSNGEESAIRERLRPSLPRQERDAFAISTNHGGIEMPSTNRQVTLAARPQGFPKESDFQLVETPVQSPDAGEVLVEVRTLSVDPYMRGRMNDAPSYAEPVALGDVMVGEAVGRVIESRNDRFAEGAFVSGMFGWQEFALSDGRGLRKLDPDGPPLSTALHVLGMPGLTAYFGLFDVCQPKPGDSVLVSAAAGAVGSTVCQLAKLHGCRVVGVAGSDEKAAYLTEQLGVDGAFNYKTTDDYRYALQEHCSGGIDAYFDNVGGPLTDAVFPQLNQGARVGICGQIAVYNAEKSPQGPRLLWHLIVKRATVRGFLVLDYADRFGEGLQALSGWVQQGKLTYRERITEGIENAPRAFMEMMQGANIGKQLVQVA